MTKHIDDELQRIGKLQSKVRWKVLIVDDERDIHSVIRMAFRRRALRGSRFSFTSAYSAKQARSLLLEGAHDFDVALVDCVMESSTAGIELCRFIQAHRGLHLPTVMICGGFDERYLRARYGQVFGQYVAKNNMSADSVQLAIRTSFDGSTEPVVPSTNDLSCQTDSGVFTLPLVGHEMN